MTSETPRKRFWRETLKIRIFAFLKIPVLFFVSPTIVALDEEECVIRIPLNWRTRNHLRSMYFAVLCAGADVAGGFMAVREIDRRQAKVSLIFKDVRAEFFKRAEGDVHFRCGDGRAISELVAATVRSGERQNMTVVVTATVPSRLGNEPVARFELTLSLKARG